MKRFIFFAIVCTLTQAWAKPVAIDRIVAVVNTDIVMLSELVEAEQFFKDKKAALPAGKTYRHQVLEQLILNKIRDGFLSQNKAGATSAMVDNAIAQIAENNKITVDELIEQLPSQGISIDELRKKISQDIQRAQLQQLLLPQNVVLNQAALKQRIAKLPKSVVLGDSPKFYHIGHILVTGEANKALANSLVSQLRRGANFAALAKKHSAAPTANTGGDLGWRQREQFPDLIAARLHNVSSGQVRGPFWAAGGWHIIKVLETQGGVVSRTFSQQELQQQAANELLQLKVNKYLNKLLQKLRQETYIEKRL